MTTREELARRCETIEQACEFMLAQRSISSQLVDTLNASMHVRARLTDVFLIDDILKSATLPIRGC